MIDNSRVILEDNQEYDVIDKIQDGNKYFIYLSNMNALDDIVIRKELVNEVDGIERHTLVGLDDDKEFDKALVLFLEKNAEE